MSQCIENERERKKKEKGRKRKREKKRRESDTKSFSVILILALFDLTSFSFPVKMAIGFFIQLVPLIVIRVLIIGLIVVSCESSLNVSINHELLTHTRMDPINDTLVIESWKLLSSKFDELIESRITKLHSYYNQLMLSESKVNISKRCDESIKYLFREAKLSKDWAVKSKFFSLID